jgi:hypothetical protein
MLTLRWKIFVLLAIIAVTITCKREPLNPLDPNNPYTLGKDYICRAESIGIGRIKLSWTKIDQPQIKGYRIYRYKPDESPVTIADVDTNLFFDSQLESGQTYVYYYRILWEDNREIHKSPEDAVKTFDSPTGFTIKDVTRTRIEMKWDDLGWLDNYSYCRIYRKNNGDFVLYDSTSSSIEYVDTHVQENVTYRFKLIAVANDGATSNFTNETYATPGNNVPRIDSIRPPHPVAIWGHSVTITCYAYDHDGDSIHYNWEALDGGEITGSAQTIEFIVPQDTLIIHRVKVTVSDDYGQGDSDTDSVLSGIRVTIDNTSNPENLTDYPVKVTLTPSNFDYSLIARLDGGDIRFYSTGGNLLFYWIESWNSGGTSDIWTKVPSIPANGRTEIYLAPLGDINALNLSNGDSTFELFDDFDDGILKPIWIFTNNGNTNNTYSEVINPGKMTLTTANSDAWGAWFNIGILYASQPAGDWEAITEVNLNGDANYQLYGLTVYSDGDNWVTIGKGYHSDFGYENVHWKRELAGSNDETGTSHPGDIVCLKIQRVGTTHYAFWSDDKIIWNSLGNAVSIATNKIGISAQKNTSGAKSATYDNFYVRKYTSPEPVVTVGGGFRLSSMHSRLRQER